MNPETNLLIAGFGGQGVASLARCLVALADSHGVRVISTIHKGGAQTLGTVAAEIRFGGGVLGPTICPGQLDVLLALDGWEALRAVAHYDLPRQALIEDSLSAGQLPRQAASAGGDPRPKLCELGLGGALRPFRTEAQRRFETPRMSNFVLGLAALPLLPAPMRSRQRFVAQFFTEVPRARDHCHEYQLD